MIDVLVWLLILLPPFDWFVAVILGYASLKYPGVLALRERAVAALICALAASIAGVLAWARLGIITLPNGVAIAFLAATLVLASVPSMVWLYLLVTGKWRIEGGSE